MCVCGCVFAVYILEHVENNWRASVASETLTGVTQSKIGDVYFYICLDVRVSFCTLTLTFLC